MSKSINIAFLFFVLLYMVSLDYSVDSIWLLKIIPIAILGAAALKTASSSVRTILLLALGFSGCGDLLLALDEFVFGLAAFLIAQLCYAILFRLYCQDFYNRWYLSFLLTMYMLVMMWLLISNLGNLQLPVMAYLMAISAMGLLAFQSSLPIRWAVLGAVFFIISDSFIAIDKFINPLPLVSYWVMSSYYVAQFMLVTGFINAVNKQPNTE
jgi:uncharacterized membrane protein YhhN